MQTSHASGISRRSPCSDQQRSTVRMAALASLTQIGSDLGFPCLLGPRSADPTAFHCHSSGSRTAGCPCSSNSNLAASCGIAWVSSQRCSIVEQVTPKQHCSTYGQDELPLKNVSRIFFRKTGYTSFVRLGLSALSSGLYFSLTVFRSETASLRVACGPPSSSPRFATRDATTCSHSFDAKSTSNVEIVLESFPSSTSRTKSSTPS